MIDYESFQKIRQCCERDGLSIAQAADLLGLDVTGQIKTSHLRALQNQPV